MTETKNKSVKWRCRALLGDMRCYKPRGHEGVHASELGAATRDEKALLGGPSKVWETFLPISVAHDVPPDAEDGWLISKGIDPIAPAMLRQVRSEVLPYVRRLEQKHRLKWFSFFLHDRASGVPTMEDDRRLFVHLRLRFPRPISLGAAPGWCLNRPCELSPEIAGVDKAMLVDGNIDRAWQLIGDESALFLKLIEAYKPDVDNLALLKQVRQFLHYFANMSQMRVF